MVKKIQISIIVYALLLVFALRKKTRIALNGYSHTGYC